MPAKPQIKTREIKGTVITIEGEGEAAATIRKMFDRISEKIGGIFTDWLESPEGQEAIRKAVMEELE